MPFLICDKCEHYYEIDSVKEYLEFHTCECGNELIYVNKLSEYDSDAVEPEVEETAPYEEAYEEEPEKDYYYYDEEEYEPESNYSPPTENNLNNNVTFERPDRGIGLFVIFAGVLLVLMNVFFLTMKFNFVYIFLIPLGILIAYFGKSMFSEVVTQ